MAAAASSAALPMIYHRRRNRIFTFFTMGTPLSKFCCHPMRRPGGSVRRGISAAVRPVLRKRTSSMAAPWSLFVMLIYLHMGALPPAGPDLRLHTADEQCGIQPHGHAVVALRQPPPPQHHQAQFFPFSHSPHPFCHNLCSGGAEKSSGCDVGRSVICRTCAARSCAIADGHSFLE